MILFFSYKIYNWWRRDTHGFKTKLGIVPNNFLELQLEGKEIENNIAGSERKYLNGRSFCEILTKKVSDNLLI